MKSQTRGSFTSSRRAMCTIRRSSASCRRSANRESVALRMTALATGASAALAGMAARQEGHSLSQTFSDLSVVATAFLSAEALGSPSGFLSFGGSENPINLPISLIGDLSSLFGGGDDDDQPKPYQLDHRVHPIYLYLALKNIVDQKSSAPKPPAPTRPSPTPPLQKAPNPCDGSGGFTALYPGTYYCGPGNKFPAKPTSPIDACCKAHDCAYGAAGLSGSNVLGNFVVQPGAAQRAADAQLCACAAKAPLMPGQQPLQNTIINAFCR